MTTATASAVLTNLGYGLALVVAGVMGWASVNGSMLMHSPEFLATELVLGFLGVSLMLVGMAVNVKATV